MLYMMQIENLKDIKTKNIKDFVLKFLKERNYLSFEENIIDAQKAFLTASVLRYCYKSMREGKLNEKQLEVYFKALYEYENSTIELKWEDGILKAQKKIKR